MRAFALFLFACLLVALAATDSVGVPQNPKAKDKAKDKDAKSDYAKLIVGTWLGTGDAEGIVIEFTKDGKVTETDTQDKKAKPLSGPYTIKGKTVTSTLGKSTQDQEIISLNDKEFKFKRSDGKELTFKRKK